MRELSLHILDLAQNSLTAGASTLLIEVSINTRKDRLMIRLVDDGKGMDAQFLRNVTSPFTTTRTTRKVGLGIPMFKANAELTGGSFIIESTPGKGTTLCAEFVSSSIDRPPLGDLAATMTALVLANPRFHFQLLYAVDEDSFSFDTQEIMGILGDVPLDTPDVVSWMQEYLQEGMQNLNGGAYL